MIYNYRYDQLNRLGSMDAWPATGSFAPVGTSPVADYSERFGYDPNGNILTLTRHGTGAGAAKNMDSLRYQYIYAKTAGGLGEYVPGQAPTTGVDHLTNQLASIRDDVTSSGYSDIKNQAAQNYQYDAIGNLTGDGQALVTNITWSVYGKILNLTDSGNLFTFTYDAAGNRISKTAHGITTWYVRDATGNVMSVYVQGDNTRNAGALTQSEVHLYGSSRLGVLNLNVNCTTIGLTYPAEYITVRGNKLFELTNHLGNVLATVSDKKLQHTPDNTVVDYYLPDVVGATDYYSFGMPMPGRTYTASGSGNYRYGFNGKENDNEVKGTGNEIDYGMRVYDPRAGRFLSVDPLMKKYPELTPYQYASNTPIQATDLDGSKGWELNSELARLKREAEKTLTKINNKQVQLPPPHPEAIITSTNPTEIAMAKQETTRREILNLMYNSEASFSIQIFNGVGAAANLEFPEAGIALHTYENIKSGDIPGALEDFRTISMLQALRIRYSFSGYSDDPNAISTPAQSNNLTIQRITLKDTRPPTGEGGSIGYSLLDGKINLASRSVTNGNFDFVVTNEGKLVIGSKHFSLSSGAQTVQAAGTLRLWKGKLMEINNNSGHYLPNQSEAENFGTILKKAGVDISGAKLNILNAKGVKVETKLL